MSWYAEQNSEFCVLKTVMGLELLWNKETLMHWCMKELYFAFFKQKTY
jgi:hypothetical protein